MATPNSSHVMDYIPDKDLYAAVMFACKMVKDGTDYHDAVRRASRYYDVEADDVRHYMSQRSGRTRANKPNKPKRKYRWFAIAYHMSTLDDYNDEADPWHQTYAVEKGFTAQTVQSRLSKNEDFRRSLYQPVHCFDRIEAFDTEQEANAAVVEWKKEAKQAQKCKEQEAELRAELRAELYDFRNTHGGCPNPDSARFEIQWSPLRAEEVKHHFQFPFEVYFRDKETAERAIAEVLIPFLKEHPNFAG